GYRAIKGILVFRWRARSCRGRRRHRTLPSARSVNAYSRKNTPKKKPGTSITLPRSAPWTKKDWMSRYFIPAGDYSFSPSTAWTRKGAGATTKPKRVWPQVLRNPDPDRMRGAATAAPKDVSSGEEEPRRIVNELGFRSILMRPNHVNGRKWSDPYYDPLWEECQKLGIPVGFHEAGRVFLPQPALSQFIPSFAMFNTLSFPMANMFACADMIYGGVMERFPKLKVAYLEGNCAWIPWLLWRMGEYAELTGIAEHPEMKLEPLEYFQRQCWGAVECDEVVAKNLPDFGLEDNIVFSTDY